MRAQHTFKFPEITSGVVASKFSTWFVISLSCESRVWQISRACATVNAADMAVLVKSTIVRENIAPRRMAAMGMLCAKRGPSFLGCVYTKLASQCGEAGFCVLLEFMGMGMEVFYIHVYSCYHQVQEQIGTQRKTKCPIVRIREASELN